jgi:hypothetical protein
MLTKLERLEIINLRARRNALDSKVAALASLKDTVAQRAVLAQAAHNLNCEVDAIVLAARRRAVEQVKLRYACERAAAR